MAVVVPAEAGLELVGAWGRRLIPGVWCGVKGLVELGSLDRQPLSKGCCWSPTRPYRCPQFTEMTRFSHYKRDGGGGGGFATLPQQPSPCKEQMEPILNVQSQQKQSQ